MNQPATSFRTDPGRRAAEGGPVRVFVGTASAQRLAARVLEHSIRRHASLPVRFTPLDGRPFRPPRRAQNRPRTPFSFQRFLIPELCGYSGRAIYLDSDMLVFGDIAELWTLPMDGRKLLCSRQEAPAAWKANPEFRPGRQMSVLVLDCGRLDWNIERIVEDLDRGAYSYESLLFDLCLVDPADIGDTVPAEWNSLERYEPGRTRLLHYTVGAEQPWLNGRNPLAGLWTAWLVEALRRRAVSEGELRASIRSGDAKPSLLACLRQAGMPARRAADARDAAGWVLRRAARKAMRR